MRKKPSRRFRKPLLENLEHRRLLVTQALVAALESPTVEVNTAFKLSTNYSTQPGTETFGVGFRLHFDPTKVSIASNAETSLLEDTAFVRPDGAPRTQGTPAVADDTNNTDNDPTTTKFVLISFADFDEEFPENVSPLIDLNFMAIAAGSAKFNYTFTDSLDETDSTPATVTITDDDEPQMDLPVITVSAAPTSVAEDGTGNLVYTFTRTGGLTATLTANFGVSGNATFNTDYTQTGAASFAAATGTVTFAAGSTTAAVTIDPTADTVDEPNETAVLTVTDGTGYTVGTANVATGTITDDDTAAVPTVSVTVSPASVAEDGSDNLIYRFTRSVASSTPLTVNYSTGGTATAGNDYTGTSTSVTIPANVLAASVVVNPTADANVEPNETVIVTISANATSYTIGTASATGTITNDDQEASTPTVSLTTSQQTAAEGVGTVTVTAALSAATDTAVTVPFTVTGTATGGSDFTITASPLTIAAGSTSATISISIINDSLEEGNESIVVTLGTPTGADLGASTVHTATIPANDGVIDGGNRIIIPPSFVVPLQVIPGDGKSTAILFRAQADTELTVIRALVASQTDEVTVLDVNLAPVPDSAAGSAFKGNLQAGNLYALMFNGHDSEAIYVVRSSAGFEALQGSSRTNILSRTDVNADGESTAGDALLILNQLARGNGAEGEAVRNRSQPGRYYDVNGDGRITALDALRVINAINVQEARGEGEQLNSALASLTKDNDGAPIAYVDFNVLHSLQDDPKPSWQVATALGESRQIEDIETAAASTADVDSILSNQHDLDDVLAFLG